jgi:hypothetical protein
MPDAAGVPNVFVQRLPPANASRARSADAAAKAGAEVSLFDLQGTASALQATFDGSRGVSAFSWSEDGRSIFFIQDDDGDENYHLYAAPVPTARGRKVGAVRGVAWCVCVCVCVVSGLIDRGLWVGGWVGGWVGRWVGVGGWVGRWVGGWVGGGGG